MKNMGTLQFQAFLPFLKLDQTNRARILHSISLLLASFKSLHNFLKISFLISPMYFIKDDHDEAENTKNTIVDVILIVEMKIGGICKI